MKIKPIFLVLVSAWFAAAVCEAAFAQTMYEIEGVIYSPGSKPVANVIVTLENHSRAQIGQDITNSDGRYRFSGIVAGEYYISVKPDENVFQPILQRIELINTTRGGSSFSMERVDFSLRPSTRRGDALVPGTFFAQTVPPEAEKEYMNAITSLTKGDKDRATTLLIKAIQVFPNYFLALQELGLVYVENQRYQEAIEPFTKAIQVNSKAAHSHLGLGIVYVNLDRTKEAIQELKSALSFDAKLFRAHLYLGMALIDTGDLEGAEKSLKQAYTLGGPIQARAAHLYLASVYSSRKQYREAIKELETYLRDNPNAANAAKIKEAIQKLKAKL